MNDLYRPKANSSRLCEVFCIQTRISEKASMSLLKDGSKIWSFIGGTATLKIRDYQCSTYKWKDKAKLLKHGQKGWKGVVVGRIEETNPNQSQWCHCRSAKLTAIPAEREKRPWGATCFLPVILPRGENTTSSSNQCQERMHKCKLVHMCTF